MVERRLFDVAQRLRAAREELAVIEEQLAALTETAEDSRLRSLVSETPLAHRDYTEAQRHADAMERARAMMQSQVNELAATQDELLDRLMADGSSPA
jgi:hypothetical protein